jgi:excisionase family DNA binding protein
VSDFITSAEAARIAGVGTTAIKRWADAGALECVRTPGGHRRFRRSDVEQLVGNGRAPAMPDESWTGWITLLSADGDLHVVQARLFGERARRGSWHRVADALGGLLDEIGRRWEAGTLSVIDEHLASAALQRALSAVLTSLPLPPGAPRCLLAAAEAEDHTLGLSLVELCLAEAGWRTEWAGSRTRATDIADRLARGGVDLVAISAAASATDRAALLREANEVGGACQAAGVALALGGRGAWPDRPSYGVRFHALLPFFDYAVGVRGELDRRRGRP